MTQPKPSTASSDGHRTHTVRTEKRVAVLGGTGSIGLATLEVLKNLRAIDRQHDWILHSVSGHQNTEALARIVADVTLSPTEVIVSDAAAAARWCGGMRSQDTPRSVPGTDVALQIGSEPLVAAAADKQVDVVVAAIVGRAGLESTLAAVEAGKRVALANKETLVVAGPLVNQLARHSGAELLPVDSEHSAIFQCLGARESAPRRVILTASGGPFRTWTHDQMREADPEAALAHPTWHMGPKITVDSATMMNKALEIIEARWLFDLAADKIEVVVHPQSIVHSLVEFEDGSLIAQLSPPDMRLPIQYALTFPRRLNCEAPRLDRTRKWDLSLEPADPERFPALELGFEVAGMGGTAGAVVNAANEEAVGLFLSRQIRFTEIVPACRKVLENHTHEPNPPLSRLLELDSWARREVRRCCGLPE